MQRDSIKSRDQSSHGSRESIQCKVAVVVVVVVVVVLKEERGGLGSRDGCVTPSSQSATIKTLRKMFSCAF